MLDDGNRSALQSRQYFSDDVPQAQLAPSATSRQRAQEAVRRYYFKTWCPKLIADDGGTLLRVAVFHESKGTVAWLVNNYKIDLTVVEQDGMTVLDYLRFKIESTRDPILIEAWMKYYVFLRRKGATHHRYNGYLSWLPVTP